MESNNEGKKTEILIIPGGVNVPYLGNCVSLARRPHYEGQLEGLKVRSEGFKASLLYPDWNTYEMGDFQD